MIIRSMVKPFILSGILLVSTPIFAMNFDDLNSVFSDTMISTSLKSKIMLNKTLSAQNIKISTSNGIVSLTGSADSVYSASLFIQTIASASGVKDIDATKLKVDKIDQPLDDMIITAEIRGLFMRYELFGDVSPGDMPVTVATHNGTVTLTEKINVSDKQLDSALKIAKSTRGVTAVDVVESQDDDNI